MLPYAHISSTSKRLEGLISSKGNKLDTGLDVHEAGMNKVEGCVIRPITLNIINLELHIWWNPGRLVELFLSPNRSLELTEKVVLDSNQHLLSAES
jgi:hypothetical protein